MEYFFSPSSCQDKASNISETPLCAHAFFGISLDFTSFQNSKNIYQ